MALITLADVKRNDEVKTFMEIADMQLSVKGYTEHSFRHVGLVSGTAGKIAENLGFDDRDIELARIAGYMHDIGNAVNRMDHAHTGAILAYNVLTKMGMDHREAAKIMMAIGNHDENSGTAVSNISAALILADKSDVHRSRVRNRDFSTFDIHDRVNYAVESSAIHVDRQKKSVLLDMKIDTRICSMIEYFEIFLDRMLMCRRAADFLKVKFELIINGTKIL